MFQYSWMTYDSPFIEAKEDLCLEFAMYGKSAPISVGQYFADAKRTKGYFISLPTNKSAWQREFHYLGTGLFQLIFGKIEDRFAAIDDVTYGPCKEFGMLYFGLTIT